MTGIVYCPVSGKRSYNTRNEAARVLEAIQRRPGHKRVGAGVYQCAEEGCNGAWHLSQSIGLVQHRKRADARRKA
jgi:hypothetical protein